MLEKLDQNIEMTEAKKHKLSIHHSNLYYPDPMGIINIAKSENLRYLAITKQHIQEDSRIAALTVIEVYQVDLFLNPKLVQRFIEYECLTGIVWLSNKLLLTVSQEQTINIYSVKNGTKILSTMTDYGPIWCMKYDERTKLLLTGTEYGYVASYRIGDEGKTIEPTNRMVKINDKILDLDFTCCPRNVESVDKKEKTKETVEPGKRKRADSSDDESDDDDDKTKSEEYLDSCEITIYGASQGNVVVWDYHKKTIIDTMLVGEDPTIVHSVLALRNGDIAVGDSSGTLSILDHKSLTCRMTANLTDSTISSIAQNEKGDRLLISGQDPTIILMKRDKLEPSNFILVEKFELHTHDVTAILFLNRKNFFTGSLDGLLARFHIKTNNGKLLEKYITHTGYQNDIKYSDEEMLIQNKRSLTIWKLPKAGASSPRKNVPSQDQMKPVKSLLLKTREYVQASTFSDKWISYSTRKCLHIFDRFDEKLQSYRTDIKLPACNTLEICSNRYLAAAAQRSLYIIDLKKDHHQCNGDTTSPDSDEKKPLTKCVVSTHMLKSNIKQMVYFESMDKLIVACSSPKNYIYVYNLNLTEPEISLNDYKKFAFGEMNISFITYNAAIKRDPNIYIYTNNDQIIRFDVSAKADDNDGGKSMMELSKKDRISELPVDANIIGMLLISREQCILYDRSRMFKVDLTSNKVINENSDYNHIVSMNNFLFHKPEQVALIELKPEDYLKLLPPTSQKRKFGEV